MRRRRSWGSCGGSEPQGLKPGYSDHLNAALKRRSSTALPSFVELAGKFLPERLKPGNLVAAF
jgi:hypothetical protein